MTAAGKTTSLANRWPIEPLIRELELRYLNDDGVLTDEAAGAALRMNADSFGRARRAGVLTDKMADRLATELVGSPWLLWPTWDEAVDWSELEDAVA